MLGRTRSQPPGRLRRAGATFLAAAAVTATAGVQSHMTRADAAVIDPNAYYKIEARHSGKFVDVANRSTADGATVHQWTDNGGSNQQWRFVATDSGYYKVVNRNSGKSLDVSGASTADGASIIQWSDHGRANQQFQIVDTDSGFVRLVARHSGKVAEVATASTADGAPLQQRSWTGGTSQQFRLVVVGGAPPGSGQQLEALNRGVVSVRSGDGNLVSWRLLATDPAGVAFNVYRAGTRLNATPLTASTTHFDAGAAAGSSYTVRAVVNGVEQAASPPALLFANGYLDVPLQVPPGGTTPSGESYSYTANDASVGDLDGDGQLEIVLKWEPSNAKDNSQSGYTGNVHIDAYRLNGQRLWRIDLGRNIRAGAHYTQFQVYDYDGDGRAEVAMKTADATVSGTGQVIGNGSADHRNSSGYILTGPEYLTMFDGLTGAIRSTVNYVPARGNVASWGDSYGNRVDRFLAATAYLDGQRPSLIMARGYYTRSVIAAWDFRNGSLTPRWVFDSNTAGSQWAGQGNHNLSIADVDADGRHEIVYGAMVVDDDGTGRWASGRGHGDALHVGDLVPSRTGLEIWDIHESNGVGADLKAASNGADIFTKPNDTGGEGPGRGVAGDIYAGSPGAEYWAALGGGVSGLFNGSGATVGRVPSSANFLVWWDGDPVRELLDDTHIDKYGTAGDSRLLTGSGVASNNGTKATPALAGDILGDWREEVIFRTSSSSALRIYATPHQTDRRIVTLLHDSQYRVALAWQNTAYNQPPHPSFFIGAGMAGAS